MLSAPILDDELSWFPASGRVRGVDAPELGLLNSSFSSSSIWAPIRPTGVRCSSLGDGVEGLLSAWRRTRVNDKQTNKEWRRYSLQVCVCPLWVNCHESSSRVQNAELTQSERKGLQSASPTAYNWFHYCANARKTDRAVDEENPVWAFWTDYTAWRACPQLLAIHPLQASTWHHPTPDLSFSCLILVTIGNDCSDDCQSIISGKCRPEAHQPTSLLSTVHTGEGVCLQKILQSAKIYSTARYCT